jgi:hypothetical protein
MHDHHRRRLRRRSASSALPLVDGWQGGDHHGTQIPKEHRMTATPPVRIRVTRHPGDPAAEVTVGRSYQATIDQDGRAVVIAGDAAAGARFEPDEYEFTRWWFRNSRDPGYQGDGWRWTLSLWLPGVPLPRWVRLRRPTIAEAHEALQARRDTGHWPPWMLDLLPLTGEQRAAVWREQAAFACSMGAHVWRDPEAPARPLSEREVSEQDNCRRCRVARVVVDPADGRGRHYVFRSTDPDGEAA